MHAAHGAHTIVMAKLSLKELKVILLELQSVCDKWYDIGLQLDQPVDFLEDLDNKLARQKLDVGTCLRKVLVEWLKSHQATWSILVEALKSDLVKEKRLANTLQRTYGKSSSSKYRVTIICA